MCGLLVGFGAVLKVNMPICAPHSQTNIPNPNCTAEPDTVKKSLYSIKKAPDTLKRKSRCLSA